MSLLTLTPPPHVPIVITPAHGDILNGYSLDVLGLDYQPRNYGSYLHLGRWFVFCTPSKLVYKLNTVDGGLAARPQRLRKMKSLLQPCVQRDCFAFLVCRVLQIICWGLWLKNWAFSDLLVKVLNHVERFSTWLKCISVQYNTHLGTWGVVG